jgi:hypothetical protein
MNICKIIEKNNRAVASLQRGCHMEAYALLRVAIADLMDRFSTHQQSCSFSPETVDSVSSIEMQVDTPSPSSPLLSFHGEDGNVKSPSSKIEQQQDTPSILSVPLWTDVFVAQSKDETLVFMYGRAFVLAPTKHSKDILTGVVLFNMALVMHALAIERGTITLLLTALKLYGKAAAVIQNYNAANACDHCWILLALYNNMAQIYLSRYRSRSQELCTCLNNIDALLASESIANIVDDDDYYFFFTNAMLYKVKFVAAPAA